MAVIVTTDWKLEEVARRTYGMCRVSWSPPFDQFDFERGFALPNPTNMRVAAQALLLALEAVGACTWLNPQSDTVVVATKHKKLHELLTKPDRVAAWLRRGVWPKGQGEARALLTKCSALLSAFPQGFVTLVHIEREDGESAFVDLDANRTDEGFDMQTLMKKGAPQEEIEKKLQETRMNGVMFSKLMASGARCYRPRAK